MCPTVFAENVAACTYATIMSIQGHHCLLIELKLCNAITCIGGKTGGGGWEINGVYQLLGMRPHPSLEPRLLIISDCNGVKPVKIGQQKPKIPQK